MTAPVPFLPPPAPTALLRERWSPMGVVATVVLGLGAALIAVLVLISAGPGTTLLITLLAAVSFPLLIAICFWLDRYEPEPSRYRLAALGWGAVIAVGFSLLTERFFFSLPGTTDFIDTAIGAPVLEELAKGLFLAAVVIFRRAQLHGVLDGIVYAALTGIGFAFVEDIFYYLGAGPEVAGVFILRGIMGPFAHPLFTSAIGIGVGIAVTTTKPALRLMAPILGYVLAVAMHGVWNGSTFWGGDGFFSAYLVVMLPLLAIVFALAVWARSREGKLLTAALTEVAAMGWIRPEETRWISRLGDRMSARAYAKRLGGRPARRALRVYQQTMIEIAFLHHRYLTGNAPRDIGERMPQLLAHAAALRPYVIVPPPPPVGYGALPLR